MGGSGSSLTPQRSRETRFSRALSTPSSSRRPKGRPSDDRGLDYVPPKFGHAFRSADYGSRGDHA
jgi:hypothetical protein